jgi:hypothetical protein
MKKSKEELRKELCESLEKVSLDTDEKSYFNDIILSLKQASCVTEKGQEMFHLKTIDKEWVIYKTKKVLEKKEEPEDYKQRILEVMLDNFYLVSEHISNEASSLISNERGYGTKLLNQLITIEEYRELESSKI